jgi:hypothetical protein
LATDPDPEPEPLYPPIDNFWINECDTNDSYFLQLGDVVGSQRRFVLSESADPATAPAGIQGYLDTDTALFHMSVSTNGGSRSYIGVYSDTGVADVYRVVLFPEFGPGRQLVMSVGAQGTIPTLNPDDRNQCAR